MTILCGQGAEASNEIGGYFGLELNHFQEYHQGAVKLNKGSNALSCLITARGYKKVYLPFYLCEVVLQAVKQLRVSHEFYSLGNDFRPIFNKQLGIKEALLYVNYFGINNTEVADLAKNYNNLIIDNCQAFFAKPLPGIDTFYSPRKFFGVPDGAYLYTELPIPITLAWDQSYDRCGHLLKRLDMGASAAFKDFHKNEDILETMPLRHMSHLTEHLLRSINYSKIRVIRNNNFRILHKALADRNQLKIDLKSIDGPMTYPFLTNKTGLRQKLRAFSVFIPCYWREVLNRVMSDHLEYIYMNNLLPLPIDQRYNEADMHRLSEIVFKTMG